MNRTETEKILRKQVKGNHSPSVQYFLFNQDSIITKYSLGYADVKNKREVQANNTYHVFSVTKTFTALAILQLYTQKKADIEQALRKYLPEAPYPDDITIRQLLTHSAGIPNPIPLSWIHLESEHQSFNRDRFFDTVFIRNNKVKSGPNDTYAYSNLGYVLLGQLIERLTGVTYEQYIVENIIKKLGLPESQLGFEIVDPGLHAKGYHKNISLSNLILGFFIDKTKYMDKVEGKWKPFKNFYVNGAPYGGLIGSPMAFVKYLQEFLNPNSDLISKENKNLLFTENITNNKKATGMCLSWFSGALRGNRYFAHAGGGGGYYCENRIYPDNKLGSVVFFNRTGMTDERFLDQVDSIYLEADK